MFALAPGQARRLMPPWLQRNAVAELRGVRAKRWLGLFFIMCACVSSACVRATPDRAAREADSEFGTHAFTWLAAHDPSALIAWNVDPARLRAVAQSARVEAALPGGECGQALAAHAALFVLLTRAPKAAATIRNVALDCGVALYRDGGALVIAPR